MGYWSYPVVQFDWAHFCPHGSVVDTKRFNEFDVIFWEDGGDFRFNKSPGSPPVVYMSIDGTLTKSHYETRLKRAAQADLVLVDHEPLSRYKNLGVPVRRLNYCVNDLVFKPVFVPYGKKQTDISFHCSSGANKGMPGGIERVKMRKLLHNISMKKNYSYKSGTLPLLEYAKSMAQSRVVVNVPRTVTNRPHRVFDTMACKTALLTLPIPNVDGDYLTDGVHYLSFQDDNDLEKNLSYLIDAGRCVEIANEAYTFVKANHTWAIRAAQLRSIFNDELGV
jgi:hypothetical protein